MSKIRKIVLNFIVKEMISVAIKSCEIASPKYIVLYQRKKILIMEFSQNLFFREYSFSILWVAEKLFNISSFDQNIS